MQSPIPCVGLPRKQEDAAQQKLPDTSAMPLSTDSVSTEHVQVRFSLRLALPCTASLQLAVPLALLLGGCLSSLGCTSQGGTVRLFPWQQGATIPPPATGSAYPGGDLSPTLGPASTPFSAVPPPPAGVGGTSASFSPPAGYAPPLGGSPYGQVGSPATGYPPATSYSPPPSYASPSYPSMNATTPNTSSSGYGGQGSNSFLPPLGPPAGAPGTHTPHWGGQFPSSGFSYPQASSTPNLGQGTGGGNWWGNLTGLGREYSPPSTWMGNGVRSGGDIFARPLGAANPYAMASAGQPSNWSSAAPSGANQTLGGNLSSPGSPNLLSNPPTTNSGLAQTSPYVGQSNAFPANGTAGGSFASPNTFAAQPSSSALPFNSSPYGGGQPGNPSGGIPSNIPLRKLDELPPATPQQVQRDDRLRQVDYQYRAQDEASRPPMGNEYSRGEQPGMGDIEWRRPR